jgi:hypothetical protein
MPPKKDKIGMGIVSNRDAAAKGPSMCNVFMPVTYFSSIAGVWAAIDTNKSL